MQKHGFYLKVLNYRQKPTNIHGATNPMLGNVIKKQDYIYVTGDLCLDEAGIIHGNIYAKGNIRLSKTTVVGYLYSERKIALGQDVLIQGDVYAGSNLELSENAKIMGNAHAFGTIKSGTESIITGNTSEDYAGNRPLLPEWIGAYLNKVQMSAVP